MVHSSRSSSVTPAHLLMVDDNRLGLLARKVVMEELGYRVTSTTSSTDALERAGKDKFDLIITDYKMPDMDGLVLIAKLRELNLNVPIILISGFADALGLDSHNTGADFVIQKSSNEVIHLVRTVKSLLRRSLVRKPPGSQNGPKTKRKNA
jgi:CheY-like chemotaxis protein